MSVRRCSICRKPGHNRATCPQRADPEFHDLPPLVAVSDSDSDSDIEDFDEPVPPPSHDPLNVASDPARLSPEIVDLANSFDVFIVTSSRCARHLGVSSSSHRRVIIKHRQ